MDLHPKEEEHAARWIIKMFDRISVISFAFQPASSKCIDTGDECLRRSIILEESHSLMLYRLVAMSMPPSCQSFSQLCAVWFSLHREMLDRRMHCASICFTWAHSMKWVVYHRGGWTLLFLSAEESFCLRQFPFSAHQCLSQTLCNHFIASLRSRM